VPVPPALRLRDGPVPDRTAPAAPPGQARHGRSAGRRVLAAGRPGAAASRAGPPRASPQPPVRA
jgi:hypothetical protein